MSLEVLMVVGFLLGAYSIVGNDAFGDVSQLQLSPHGWLLRLFAAAFSDVVSCMGGWFYDGDVS